MTESKEIDIVLATYNGEKFIEEQITSIQKNEHYGALVRNIIVVDDGSCDSTLSLVDELSRQDDKILFFPSEGYQCGPLRNFERGIAKTTANYVMFCDQDDFWLSNKLQKFFDELQLVSRNDSALLERPLAIFSDLIIVNESLESISDSYYKLKKIPYSWHEDFNNLIMQNVVSGCAMLVNRKLINEVDSFPDDAYMHDWWMALVAKRFGYLHFIEEPTVLYRQHSDNAIGAKPKVLWQYTFGIATTLSRFYDSFEKTVAQAKSFSATYGEASELDALKYLSNWYELSILKRLSLVLQGKVKRSTIASTCLILFAKKRIKRVMP